MFSSSPRVSSQAAEQSRPWPPEPVCLGPRVKLNEASWQSSLPPAWTALLCQNGSFAYFSWRFISLRFCQSGQICWAGIYLENIGTKFLLCHCWILSPLRESSGTPQSAMCSPASCSHGVKSALVIKLPVPKEDCKSQTAHKSWCFIFFCNLVLAIAQNWMDFAWLISFNLHNIQ